METKKKQVCFPNLHMRPEEYALWDVSRKLSHETGVLYFDGRDLAKLFEGAGKDRVYRAAKSLIEKGWYEVITPARRDPRTGLFLPAQYRVLSPEQWATLHRHICGTLLESSLQSETGNQSSKRERPVLKTRMTSPQNATYSDKENYEEEIMKKRESAACSSPQNATGAKPSLSNSEKQHGQGKSPQKGRRELANDYFIWLIQKFDLILNAKEKAAIETAILSGSCDSKLLKEATARNLDGLDPKNSFDRAGEKLAVNLPLVIEANRREADQRRKDEADMARLMAEVQARSTLEREAAELARAEQETGIEDTLAFFGKEVAA